MKTIINHNGSRSLGAAPASLGELYRLLQREPLDPAFERTGDFVCKVKIDGDSMLRFWGNFFAVSHGFSIDTNDPAVIETLMHLIKLNKQRVDYRDARTIRRAETVERLCGGRA